jgi:hypothetical protein
MERLFKGHQLCIVWNDDYTGFVVKCTKLSDNSRVFVYMDYDSITKYEAMHVAKVKLGKMLKL